MILLPRRENQENWPVLRVQIAAEAGHTGTHKPKWAETPTQEQTMGTFEKQNAATVILLVEKVW
jgi:hypothetical protein